MSNKGVIVSIQTLKDLLEIKKQNLAAAEIELEQAQIQLKLAEASKYRFETYQEVVLAINHRKEQAEASIKEAEEIARVNDVAFAWSLRYGMGGSYEKYDGEWQWVSSSQNC